MKLLKKLDLMGVLLFICVVVATWLIADYLTPSFTTEDYLSGFHINHSFVGLFIVFAAFVLRNKLPNSSMFIVLLALGTTLIVHDGLIFRELGVLP